jgi:hypothetical protein
MTSPHPRDQAVAAALKGAQAMPSSGQPVLIAFRNEDGQLYRYAVLEGSAQIRYLRQRLVQLNLLSDVDDAGGVLQVLGSIQASLLRA